jgi:hypothetical protein
MKIPYGLSNFKKVITEGFVYDVKYQADFDAIFSQLHIG